MPREYELTVAGTLDDVEEAARKADEAVNHAQHAIDTVEREGGEVATHAELEEVRDEVDRAWRRS